MKRIILALVLLLPNLIYAQAGTLKPAPEFAGIKIDSSLDYCVKQFVAKGYKLEKSENNIATLKGTLGADDIELFLIATISSKKVWKAAVYFPEQSTWSGLKQKYSTLKDLLDNKYGDPKDDYHFFSSPYEEGDGDEITAVKAGKCNYLSAWEKPENNATIVLEISKFQQVEVSYENSINVMLNKQEKEKATSDGL